MRRFTKRLLTGVVSGAMALSLFPAAGVGGYEVKAEEEQPAGEGQGDGEEQPEGEGQSDIVDYEFDHNEMTRLPGDISPIEGFNVVYAYDDNGERRTEVPRWARVIDATVPDEYKDYVRVIPGDDNDENGYPDYVDISSRSEWYDEEELILADKRQDSIGKTIPLTVTYIDEEGNTGTAPYTYNIVDGIYDYRCIFENGTEDIVPGQSQTVSVEASHQVAEWVPEWEKFDCHPAELENPSYAWSADVDFISVEGNGSEAVLTARALNDGEFEDGFHEWYNLNVALSENGTVVDEFQTGGFYTDVAYGLTPAVAEGFDGLKVGGSINYRPVITMYNADNLPNGTTVEDARPELGCDPSQIEIKDNGDGSYTITRLKRENTWFDVGFSFMNNYGDMDHRYVRYDTDWLDFRFVALNSSSGTYLLFDDSKSVTYTLDASQIDALYENPDYTVKWQVGRMEGYDFTEVFGADSEGWSVTNAADGIKVEGDKITLDGTVIVSKYTVTEDNGEKRIDGDDRIWIKALFYESDGEPLFEANWSINMRNAMVDYAALDIDNYEHHIELLPGETEYLDKYIGFVQNDANPTGRFFPLDINVTSIKSYEFNDGSNRIPKEKFNLLTFGDVDGRKALTAVSVLPSGAKEGSDLYGQSVVEATYKDLDGNERNVVFHVDNRNYREGGRFTSTSSNGVSDIYTFEDVIGTYGEMVSALKGDEVSFNYEFVSRKYNEETGKIEESIVEPARVELETKWANDGVEATESNGVVYVSGSQNEPGALRFSLRFFVQSEVPDENGIYNEMESGSIGAEVRFEDRFDKLNELPYEDIEKDGIGEWTPKLVAYSSDASEPVDTTADHSFGFSYNQDELSITAKDGKEVGNSFTDGPFVIAKKTAADVDLRILIADVYAEDVVYYNDFYKDVAISGPAAELTKDISTLQISEITAKAWTGSTVKPAVTIKDGTKKLKAGTDYTVAYKNNKNAGKATVTITGKGDYSGTVTKTFQIKKPTLKYRAYVQKKGWMGFQTAAVSATPNTKIMAGTTDNLRMETIQMQLSGVDGQVRYRAYCQKKGWVGVGTEEGGWATTANKNTNAGTKAESRRVEMIQLQAKGEVSSLYDIYYQAYSEKFGWLAWAGNNEKAGSAGYALKLEAFRVQLVPKGAKFDKIKGAAKKKSYYDSKKDGKNPE